jgi:hypothetical protein
MLAKYIRAQLALSCLSFVFYSVAMLAANAFEEFWPDIKKRIFRKRN